MGNVHTESSLYALCLVQILSISRFDLRNRFIYNLSLC
jgi:hypothetical protein